MKSGYYYSVNDQIRAPKLRVIGEDGKQLGVLSREEALEKARASGLSLIEIAPGAVPPVAKIYDLGKFRYQEEKKLKGQKKGRGGEVKEIRFSPFIAENDYNTRLERVREFLGDKNKVRLVVVFKKRQLEKKEFGYKVLRQVVSDIGADNIAIDMEPKFLGKSLMTVISPISGKKNAETKDKKID